MPNEIYYYYNKAMGLPYACIQLFRKYSYSRIFEYNFEYSDIRFT